jgi:glycosyltransferase involved in cell wall biosynthesis
LDKKPRILVICQEDPEWLLGGMGRHLQELYKEIARQGEVEVDLLVGGPADEAYKYNGFMKHHSDKLLYYKPKAANMASLLISDLQLVNTFTRLLAQGKRWDLVHVHEWNSMQVAKIARDALSVPMVGTMHLCISSLMEETNIDPSKYAESDIYLMQQEGHLIVDPEELILCSYAYEKLIRRLFMTDRSINMIYNGIDMEYWSKSEVLAKKVKQKLMLPDKPIALFVGRIADMKGIREILEAVENWQDCPYFVVLAGEVNANSEADKEGWDVTKWIRRLEEACPDRIRWVGFQNDEDLKGLYSLAEIGLMPSLAEPFGIVALEFMAMGVPLISTEVEGLGEVVTDPSGNEYALIIDSGDVRQIREAMEHLYKNLHDMQTLHSLGRVRAQHFGWDSVARKTTNLYIGTIEKRRIKHDHLDYAYSS